MWAMPSKNLSVKSMGRCGAVPMAHNKIPSTVTAVSRIGFRHPQRSANNPPNGAARTAPTRLMDMKKCVQNVEAANRSATVSFKTGTSMVAGNITIKTAKPSGTVILRPGSTRGSSGASSSDMVGRVLAAWEFFMMVILAARRRSLQRLSVDDQPDDQPQINFIRHRSTRKFSRSALSDMVFLRRKNFVRTVHFAAYLVDLCPVNNGRKRFCASRQNEPAHNSRRPEHDSSSSRITSGKKQVYVY